MKSKLLICIYLSLYTITNSAKLPMVQLDKNQQIITTFEQRLQAGGYFKKISDMLNFNITTQATLEKLFIDTIKELKKLSLDTDNNNIDVESIENFVISSGFKKLQDSFQNALHPRQGLQYLQTAIGYFVWDLQQSMAFGNNTYFISKLFLDALYQFHKTPIKIDFGNVETCQDFVTQHRHLVGEQKIESLTQEISSLIELIQQAPLEKLLDAKFLEKELLLQLGLNNENIHEFPKELEAYYGKGLKSWQYPNQFSKFLVSLSKLKADYYLEIGCRHGGTFIIISEYLKRFNPNITTVAIDPLYSPIMDAYVHKINNKALYILDFSTSTRFIDLSQIHWDISFIDGDHSFKGVMNDYMFVRANSDTLVFHDIVNKACPGVIAFWDMIKKSSQPSNREEFIEQYPEVLHRMKQSYLGIGMLHQK